MRLLKSKLLFLACLAVFVAWAGPALISGDDAGVIGFFVIATALCTWAWLAFLKGAFLKLWEMLNEAD